LAIKHIRTFDQRLLHLPVWLHGDAGDAGREARLDVDVAEIGWDQAAQEFLMKDVSLTFGFLGSRVTLKGARPGRDGAAMVFTWAGAAPAAGRLSVRRARLRVGKGSQLRFRHELHLAPGGAAERRGSIAVKTVDSWGSDGGEACRWPAHLTPGCSVRVLGLRASATFTAGPRSLAVARGPQGSDSIKALLPGFPAGGAFHFGLVAGLGGFNGESAVLGAGSLSGSIEWTEGANAAHALQLESICFEARSGLRGETSSGWQGRMLLSGDVAGTSAIAWPAVDLKTGGAVPMPPVDTTITPVALDKTVWHRHSVIWLLRNHEMAFPVAAGLRDRRDAVWSVTALARHTLTRVAGDRTSEQVALVFCSVDTLTLAPMRVFAPPWPTGGHAADLQASSTFAARYKAGATSTLDQGMSWPGRGGLGTVLQGFGGEQFRKAFYSGGDPGDGRSLVIAGSFSGLITLPGVDAAPLLRLPALVALEGSLRVPPAGTPKIRQDADVRVEVAWVDGAAALDVVVPWRSAVATVSAAQADLERAMDAGMRSAAGADPRNERLFNSVLVEQCFPVTLDGSNGLAHTPYFIASAVSLARAIAHVEKEKEAKAGRADEAAASLSVVSRVSLVLASGKAYRQGAAAVLQASPGQFALSTMPPRPAGQLLVVGDDLTQSAWLSGEVGTQADGRVAAIASELHKLPRVALVRDSQGKHTAIELPRRQLRPPVRRTPKLVYADVARGYMLQPQESVLMAGAEEGWTGAVRDAATGLAAMGRVAALPAQAQGSTGGGHAVWLTQQRVPVYLPLASTIAAEPIAWMDPGSARARVPVGAEVDSALARATGPARETLEEDTGPAQVPVPWQGIVPMQAATTSVSDRAGVLIARRLRLEVAAHGSNGERYPFDVTFPRFGEPAQASSSHARTERTPRPGILPPNTADMERNRRPCVSPLRTEVNNRAVLGSADAVRGHTQWRAKGAAADDPTYSVGWAMNFVACPRTCGVISDPWDGTLDFTVEVDVLEELDQASLSSYLAAFVLDANFEAMAVAATASIVVNGKEFPFASLHIRDMDVGPPIPPGTSVRRGYVALVLDMRAAGAAMPAPGPAHAALAAIRNAGPVLPTVEVQFTLHPRALARWPVPQLAPEAPFALGVGQSIPHGDDRAPVTLRFPLFAVTRERGAMPLEPATLLFMDPAYDAGLASQPSEDAQRIPEKATPPALPQGRGDMMFVLSADRARMNRGASVTFMA
ncbi:MAG: hypothetical protein KA756_11765, partial [Steroidobacteraceae bacterium]|nr:hypothetical protein [Steroidobacteraceae bacterium]